MHGVRSAWGRGLLAAVLGLAIAGLVAVPGLGTPVNPPAVASAGVETHRVTLVTGDVVRVRLADDGSGSAELVGGGMAWTQQTDDEFYVVPWRAMPYFFSGTVDRALFDVRTLVEQRVDDDDSGELPLIVSYRDGALDGARRPAAVRGELAAQPVPAGGDRTAVLESAQAVALTEDKDRARRFWEAIDDDTPQGEPRLAGGIEKLWLDYKVKASLDVSTAQVGAPAAWASGFDGTGTTVAVLDTGIDAGHPDFAGRIAEEANFTETPDAVDRHGHGTHVASIALGSGAASGGRYRGVAPGARLLSGKVLNDSGFGRTSMVIAGMEWAAQRGADVVNLSLSGPTSDGTDPGSQAVDSLTAEHGTLFVAAAGNDGFYLNVGSSAVATSALAVGAVDDQDRLTAFSNRGPRRVDFAIKPELVAPGVRIAAGRAAQGRIGTPIDAFYTRLSGTSMATPHVAGAAAALAQRHRDWTPEQLKAHLVATSAGVVPPAELAVPAVEHGAGRLDVARAVRQDVSADAATVTFGQFESDDAPARSRTVTYRNGGDSPVTLELAVSGVDHFGQALPAGMLTVSPARLEIQPGASAAAQLTVDRNAGPEGLGAGVLTATGSAADAHLRTPVSFNTGAAMRRIGLSAIGRDGRPAYAFIALSSASLTWWRSSTTDSGGFFDSATAYVPDGRYTVTAQVFDRDVYEAEQRNVAPREMSVVVLPDVRIAGNDELVIDARKAVPTRPRTSHPTEHVGAMLEFRTPSTLERHVGITELTKDIYVTPTERLSDGPFHFYSLWELVAPDIEARAVGARRPIELEVETLNAPPTLDGRLRRPLVDAGHGTPQELAASDVRGMIALIQETVRPDGIGGWRTVVPIDRLVRDAAAAGAAGAIIHSALPGRMFVSGRFALPIPAYTVSGAQGQELVEALERAGVVTMDLRGIADSPYAYHLLVLHEGRIPAAPNALDGRSLARVETTYHSDVEGQHHTGARFEVRAPFILDYPVGSVTAVDNLFAPQVAPSLPSRRVEYFTTTAGQEWSTHVYTPEWGAAITEFERMAPDDDEARLYAAPYHVDASVERGRQGIRGLVTGTDGTDTRTILGMFGSHAAITCGSRLSWPGFVGETPPRQPPPQLGSSGCGSASFANPPAERTEMRFENTITRAPSANRQLATEVRTAWTFFSEHSDQTLTRPLLDLDYDLEVDSTNSARERSETDLELGLERGGERVSASDLDAWASFDDGATWRELRVRRGEAEIDNPRLSSSSGYVSLRVRAEDPSGESVDQTIIRAYRLRDGGDDDDD
jgi:subtilisin family serine protease